MDVSPNIFSNTISGNYATMDTGAGGMRIWGVAAPTVKNCIIWNNSFIGGYYDYAFQGSPTVSYCDLGEGASVVPFGPGVIYVDPLFAGEGDYHLRSTAGRWDPAANGGNGSWVIDDVNSPGIDAGDPGSVFSNEPSPNGDRINMGAYGNTAEASKTEGPPFIAVTSPNGGETWNSDSGYEITWDSNFADNVKIALYKGGTWNRTLTGYGGTVNDGVFEWTVPADQAEGGNYRIVIFRASNMPLYDYSDAPFTIAAEVSPFIAVTSPNGGESWQAGTTHTIAWTSNAGGTVDISLYRDGVFDSAIATGEANDGAYSWTIPGGQAAGADYRVRVTSTASASVTDESNADFTITAAVPFITVTSPDGGETWAAGSSQEITWEGDGAGNVKVYLYKGGTYYSTMSSGTPNDGSFTWAIPPGHVTGSNFRAVVVSASVGGLYDYSDAPFSIAASP